MRTGRVVRLAAVVAGVVAVGVGFHLAARFLLSGGTWDATTGSTTPYQAVENLDDFFHPDVIRVAVGTEVTWHNDGRNPHTVTADDGSFDSGVLQHGADFERTFDQPGVYRYNCRLHGAPGVGMIGTIVVGDVPLPASPGGVAGVGPGREPVATPSGTTLHVPADAPTIQAAVDRAKPGDLVLVAPGVYHEAVLVQVPYLTIRGTDRNAVILDGDFKLANGIHVVEADGVVIENLTARHYQLNGFYWTRVNGYRGSYLTAYGDGDYGIYAFDSTWGRFEHSYAAGHPDSGIYIGQCQPCHAVIDDVVSVHNALGYSGTNAGGDFAIVNSEWRDNMSGIDPNTLDSELLAPQAAVTIAGNWVHDNGALDAPSKALEYPSWGNGILIGGGRSNVVEGNLVEDQPTAGIAVVPNLDANLWMPQDNAVRGNLVRRTGITDLGLAFPSGGDDCFEGNRATTSLPGLVELRNGCGDRPRTAGDPALTFGLLARFIEALSGRYPHGDWQAEPPPPAQPQMPGAATAVPVLAVPEAAVPGPYTVRSLADLEAISKAGDDGRNVHQEVTVLGIPVSGSPLAVLLGLYGYVFPLVLFAAWVAISLWDLVRRDELTGGRRVAWMAAVLVVPFVGPLVYFGFGGSSIPRSARLMLTVGGLAVWLGLTALIVAVFAA